MLVWLSIGLVVTACGGPTQEAPDRVTDSPPSIISDTSRMIRTVVLTKEEMSELQIPLHQVQKSLRKISLPAPGVVFPAPNYMGIISAPVEGRIVRMPVQEGDPVIKGDVFVEMESLTFGSLVADYLRAIAEIDYQESQLQRIEKLVAKKINPEAELEMVKADYIRAQAGLSAAFAKLKAIGVQDEEIESFHDQEKINPVLKIHVPITGLIDQHTIELGQAVAANEKLATVINLDQVLVKAYLSPEDGKKVRRGDLVVLEHRLSTGKSYQSVVTSINPGLQEDNRSMVINILTQNPGQWLNPGDNIRTEIFTSTPVEMISVPMEAITYDNDYPVVFIKMNGNRFEMRKIEIGEIHNNQAEVISGLVAGEVIAGGQVFNLKALARFDLIAEE